MPRIILLCALALFGTTALAAPASAAPAALFSDPVYDYTTAIRETVYVDTTLDNDGNGTPDRVVADIIRPREAATAGVKVPVIMDASPYYQCCGRGNESEKKVYAADGTVTKFPLYYDNYFVPRGYAYIAADLAGTSRSTGCEDVGGTEEVQGAKAVVDWLNGRAVGRTASGTVVTASAWATGKVGMIGKSWDGTIANAVAATGVPGLETIVPISAISSWYDYNRVNGMVNPKVSSVPSLHSTVNGRPSGTCTAVSSALSSGAVSNGNYNSFWNARNYAISAASVHASVFVVHGMNDLNVQGVHFGQWWDALAANNVPRKIWLSQEGHVDPFDFRRAAWVDTLHRWFDFWLLGIDNGIMTEPMADVERAADVWQTSAQWPPSATTTVNYVLQGTGNPGVLASSGAGSGSLSLTDAPSLSEANAVSSPTTSRTGRRVYQTPVLTSAVRVAGTPTITLRVRSSKATTTLTAKLVAYGTATRVNYRASGEGISTLTTQSCWGSSSSTDDACYRDTAKVVSSAAQQVISRGWMDGQHRDSLTTTTAMNTSTFYTITFKLRPIDQVIAAGQRLGVVLTLSDPEFVSNHSTGATVTFDLAGSVLKLPIAPADGLAAQSLTAAPVVVDDEWSTTAGTRFQ
ncbi:X-Pro dipeptidyl-peptidase [Rhizocola hellebori]|uniref:X-Pro dipeptidyl-peptidase n=1 Tax=Rhizocola hellebori TaxID=1392758 RepID=A0A8J3VDJ4_9ACTN|nr:Xaa-Pro dipeptidyl-peptidase [Rhizocola hellebori]GIH02517.1 X-Pro dipeptidyl-peptidase [Rhizocola hellebori]